MNKDEENISLVVLGLGSNMGNSRLIVNNAIAALEQEIKELRRASFFETDPLYVTDQAKFLNTAVAGLYSGTPRDLLSYVNYIESRFGRNRSLERHWGERILDIDILLFGNILFDEPDLVIPHKLLKERRFALEPLLELLPDAADPGTGFFYWDICQTLPDQGVIKLPYESEVLPE